MGNATDACHLADTGDPDVAGLGVTVAFLVSICLTAVIIIALYFRHGLHPDLYSYIDKAVINQLNPKRNRPHDAIAEPLNDALRKLLFTLSDQQLAGGLSLAVVVYIRFAKTETFSAYSFQMATATVFMSCITHMSTLAALPDEFAADCGRLPRVLAMTTLALLTIPILVMSNLPSYFMDLSLSLKCARKQFSVYPSTERTSAILVSAVITFMLISGYVTRINAVRARKISASSSTSAEESIPSPIRIYHGSRARDLLTELKSTFLWELLSLAFYYTFGLLMLIMTWTGLPPLTQWSLSFGQLLPGGLLLWTVIPTYTDYRKAVDRQRRGEEERRHHSLEIEARPPSNATKYENHTILDSKRDETLSINEYTVDENGRDVGILQNRGKLEVEDYARKNGNHIDSIELSPSHPSFACHQETVERGATPAHAPHFISAKEHRQYRHHKLVLITAFLVKFIFGEFMAVLLGGGLTALGGPFNLFALLTFLLLRATIQVLTVVLLRQHSPLVRYLSRLMQRRTTRTGHFAGRHREVNVKI